MRTAQTADYRTVISHHVIGHRHAPCLLRDLADFLEGNPEVPAPRWADVMVFPPQSTDIEMKAAIDAIAALIGADINDQTAENGHYTASREFGSVQYKAVGIPARSLARRAAHLPYAENIPTPESTEEA
jgi:hypothetical protein